VVQGFADTGRLLTRHPDIRKVSLTGEVGTGKAVMSDAAQSLKNVTLELGGKSPLIVFERCQARQCGCRSAAREFLFFGAGLLQRHAGVRASIDQGGLSRAAGQAGCRHAHRRSDGSGHAGGRADFRAAHAQGAGLHRARPRRGRAAGDGRRARDRGRAGEGLLRRTHRIRQLPRRHGIVREEIFGPVMSVLEFEDEQEVIERANATEFGLAAGVFTNDLTRGHRVIARLQAGTCWINHYNVTPIELPFGGVKMSGLGRENGRAALEHYTQLKSVYVAMGDVEAPY
jgi:betaine-aldehyde dehydrogenase